MALPFLKSKNGKGAKPDDPLAQFEAESAISIHGRPVSGSPDTGARPDVDTSLAAFVAAEPLSLETVIGRRTPVFWLEAVAIIEATCAAITPADGAELPAPDPSDILLTSDGTIEVRSGFGFGRADSVQRLARTLHVLTSGQAIPAPLRLFVSKWIAADGNHTIAEFAREVAYFARPNGAELIREVYMRCAAAAVAKKQTLRPSAPRVEGEAPKAPTSPKPQAGKRSRAAVVAAAVAFIVAIVAGIAVARSQPPGQAASSDLLASLLARAAEFARSLGEVRTQIGDLSAQLSAHLASGEEPAAAKPAPAPAGARGAANRARGNTRPSAATAPATARGPSTSRLADLVPGAAGVLPGASPAPTPDIAPAQPVEVAPPMAAAAIPVAVAAPNPEAIYSGSDADVNPPKMLYPQLPPAPLVLGASNNVNMMEMIIGDDGSVEKVKLVSPPRRMTDMMLLSGAKSWKFAPASRGGFPVRYRIAVSWATTP